jgi:hypothetical protein
MKMKTIPYPQHDDKIILRDKKEVAVLLDDPDAKGDTIFDPENETWQLIYEINPELKEESDIEYINATWSDALKAWVEVENG